METLYLPGDEPSVRNDEATIYGCTPEEAAYIVGRLTRMDEENDSDPVRVAAFNSFI